MLFSDLAMRRFPWSIARVNSRPCRVCPHEWHRAPCVHGWPWTAAPHSQSHCARGTSYIQVPKTTYTSSIRMPPTGSTTRGARAIVHRASLIELLKMYAPAASNRTQSGTRWGPYIYVYIYAVGVFRATNYIITCVENYCNCIVWFDYPLRGINGEELIEYSRVYLA